MKRTTILIFLLVLVGHINAQYLIVNNSSLGGNYIPFQDTILSSIDPIWGTCTDLNYYIDLDQDSIQDIEFYLWCYMGGMGSDYEISLATFNDFSIHVDTSYIEHFQFIDSVGQVHDTIRITPVVKKYNWGDTIFNNQDILATEEKMLYYSFGNYPPCLHYNIDLFLEDTSYIAFEKSNGDLYCLEIYVPFYSNLELTYAKTNAQTFGINENELLQNYLFPNPARKVINFRKAYDYLAIYSAEGTLLVEKNELGTQKTIDISYLKSGFYIVILKKDRTRYITKLLKI